MSIVTQNNKIVMVSSGALTIEGSGGSSGSGITAVPEKDVNFIDYDGTILYSYTKLEFASLSALPANPSHDGLIAQGWNWTKQEITAHLTAMPDNPVFVGQMYITTSGKTEIDIELNNPYLLSPYLKIAVNGTVTIDWGDGSTANTVTGTSLTTGIFTQHTYTTTGSYTISIGVTSGNFTFYDKYMMSHINSTSDSSKRYTNSIIAVRLGSGITSIGTWAFSYCYCVRNITIPNSVTSIGTYAFGYCLSLQSVTIPSGVTSLVTGTFFCGYSLKNVSIPNLTSMGGSMFCYCRTLLNVTVPSGITTLWGDTFRECYCIHNIDIPSGVTFIATRAFQSCSSIQSLTIPSNVTSIQSTVFTDCYSLYKLTFKPASPPTIDDSDTWSGIPTDCIIYVPSGKLSAYTTATNYPDPSTYTYMEEST